MEPHAGQPVVEAGVPLGQAPAAVIMVHGRNAGAGEHPRSGSAAGASEPHVSGAGRRQSHVVPAQLHDRDRQQRAGIVVRRWPCSSRSSTRIEAAGIPRSRIVLLGFSQGACLTAEFAVRHASRFGGVVVFSGGVIGPPGTRWDDAGRFDGTPVFLGCSDRDSHVPESRVIESARALRPHGRRRDHAHLSGHGTSGQRRRDRVRAGTARQRQRACRRATECTTEIAERTEFRGLLTGGVLHGSQRITRIDTDPARSACRAPNASDKPSVSRKRAVNPARATGVTLHALERRPRKCSGRRCRSGEIEDASSPAISRLFASAISPDHARAPRGSSACGRLKLEPP